MKEERSLIVGWCKVVAFGIDSGVPTLMPKLGVCRSWLVPEKDVFCPPGVGV